VSWEELRDLFIALCILLVAHALSVVSLGAHVEVTIHFNVHLIVASYVALH